MISIKRLSQIGLILATGFAMPSWAVYIDDSTAGGLDGTDVGLVDRFIAEGEKQGNPTDEEEWVNMILGNLDPSEGPTTYTVKNEDVSYFMTNEDDVFAFELESEPAYYLIKNAKRIALFENLEEIPWGVFDTTELSGAMNLPGSEYTISHVTEFGGGKGVPEPGVLGLLGIGMIGIVLGRRRMAA